MSVDYRSIMSGKHRGLIALMLRMGLWVCSLPYSVVTYFRNRQFDSGKRQVDRAGIPVVSVGNLTTGGTGKTPIVCYLARYLRGRGVRVAIVSRGYGRGEEDSNDEALELHDRLPDVPHLQNPDRVESARVATDELESEVIVMDDGFQHRRLHRDFDLVALDCTCPFGYGYQLPRGLLRESISGLRRADFILLTRCDLVSSEKRSQIKEIVRTHAPDTTIIEGRHAPLGLFEYPDVEHPLEKLSLSRVAVVSAIGNPGAFESTLEVAGARLVSSMHLPDHDAYSSETVDRVRNWIVGLGDAIDFVVCTHKDLVKLRADRLGGKSLLALTIHLVIEQDEGLLTSALDGVIDQAD